MSDAPDTTWPTLPAASEPSDPPQPRPLAILIEQYVTAGQGMRWTAEEALRFEGTREQGRDAALRIARTFRPQHPAMDSGRTIYRSNPDVLQVIVAGAVQNFRFRVLVVELLEDVPN